MRFWLNNLQWISEFSYNCNVLVYDIDRYEESCNLLCFMFMFIYSIYVFAVKNHMSHFNPIFWKFNLVMRTDKWCPNMAMHTIESMETACFLKKEPVKISHDSFKWKKNINKHGAWRILFCDFTGWKGRSHAKLSYDSFPTNSHKIIPRTKIKNQENIPDKDYNE